MVKHECANCKRGKRRIANLLRNHPNFSKVIVDDDYKNLKDRKKRIKPMFPNEQVSPFLPTKDYYPDVYAELSKLYVRKFFVGWDNSKTQSVILEVDHKTHYSDAATHKDNIRDKHFLKKGIPTIRFKLKDIIGNKPLSDKEILSLIDGEIEYQLSHVVG